MGSCWLGVGSSWLLQSGISGGCRLIDGDAGIRDFYGVLLHPSPDHVHTDRGASSCT